MKAKFETELGDFTIQLAMDEAPITAAYFRDIIKSGAFVGSSIFRIVGGDNAAIRADNPIEVVQGGLKDTDDQPVDPVCHEQTSETGHSQKQWSVSAARFGPGETYGSYFICMRDEPALDFGGKRHPDGQGFAVFGKVISGFEVVQAIFEKRESEEFLKSPLPIRTCSLVNI